MLNYLPREILFEIFDILSVEDLLNLSIVCRAFNIFINNTKLVEKFTLSFDHNFNKRDWIGSRKYTKLSIETDTGAFGILKCIGDDIKKISFSAKSIDLKNIARILVLCPNLSSLKFVDVKTHSCLDFVKRSEMPRHKNLELWIQNTTPNILEIFKYVEVTKLILLAPTSLSDFGMCWRVEDCCLTFNNFMKSQRNLEHLDMRSFKFNAKIFSNSGLDSVFFRLKMLRLENFDINNANFTQFLANHTESLESVCLDSRSITDELMMILAQCKQLSKMKFKGNFKTYQYKLKNVIKLRAQMSFSQSDWTEMFPNLRELKISSSCETSFQKLDNLTNLQRLEIYNSHFYDKKFLNIPSVKFLTLRDISFDSPNIFKRYPEKLEEFFIESSSVEFLVQFLAFNKVNLKQLVIKNPFMLEFYKDCLNFDSQRVKSVKIYKSIQPPPCNHEFCGNSLHSEAFLMN